MRFWDASALIPLVVSEPSSERLRALLAEDLDVLVWVWTLPEMISGIERRFREGSLSRTERIEVLSRIEELSRAWDEVSEVLAVRDIAVRLLARHPLRAADAGQLGAAMLAANATGSLTEMVTLDDRLGQAAEIEGFVVTGSS